MADQEWVELAISGAVIAAGAGLWLRSRLRKRAAVGWPMAQGKVLWATVSFQGGGDPASSRYVAQVRYTYVVQGEAYSGDYKRSFMWRDSADTWAGAFQTGRQLIVRYKPDNLRNSIVLEEEQSATAVA